VQRSKGARVGGLSPPSTPRAFTRREDWPTCDNLSLASSGSNFYNARRALMAPHPQGEIQAFASALEACSRALYPSFDDGRVRSPRARECLAVIRQLKSVHPGTYAEIARALTPEQRTKFSSAVDTAATYFDREVMGDIVTD
jgi:hypothetical protein